MQRELDDNEALSCTSKSTTKGDTKFCGLKCDVDGVALLTSLSSLAETNGSDILEKKQHTRAEADSSSSSSGLSSVGSTRSSTHSSDIASQLDEDEEIFEDASSVLPDGTYGASSCMCTYRHVHMRTYAHVHLQACACIHTHAQHACTHIYTCAHAHTHIHMHMHTYIQAYMCA